MYYVYAIHTDSKLNRRYDQFEKYQDAEQLEADMKRGCYPGDNYVVHLIYANNEPEVNEKIKSIRKNSGYPV